MNRSRRRAFTLVELLVVMAIISLLAGLLMSSLAAAKAKGTQAACLNNLKQLGTAWNLYNGDNSGRIPSCVPFYTRGVVNSNAWVLGISCPSNRPNPFGEVDAGVLDATNQNALARGKLYPAAGAPGIYRCPADSRSIQGVPFVRSYSMNNWMNGIPYASWDKAAGLDTRHRLFQNESGITKPARFFVLIDEDASTLNDAMFVTLMNPVEGLEDQPSCRHKTGYSIAFADGHAEIFRFLNPDADAAALRNAATELW